VGISKRFHGHFCPAQRIGVQWQWQFSSGFWRCSRRGLGSDNEAMMNKQLVEVVLPRLARTLYHELERYRSGKLDEDEFSTCFENLLQRQHRWLMARGVPEMRAALAIHGAVLVLSMPGLRAEAAEEGLPLEVMEQRAIREAATDVASNFGVPPVKAMRILSKIVARYGD